MESNLTAINASPSSDDQGIQLGDLVRSLRRRRRLGIAIFIITLLAGASLTAWQRAYRPVFQGSFKLLVKDPINSDRADSGSGLETLALQERGGAANTAALIQVLSSPLLLSPIERRLGLSEGQLGGITITQPTGSSPEDGILVVSLQWPDPEQGQEILQKLSAEYLSFSLRQRQEKLNQGLAFLDQQAPELQARVGSLQNRLAALRQGIGFVEPMALATALTAQRDALSSSRKQLELEQAKLEGLIIAVERGYSKKTVSEDSSASRREASSGEGAKGSKDEAQAPSMAKDLLNVEMQLAEAQAIYTDEAPQLRELKAKRDTLRPLLRRQELGTLETNLAENKAQLAELARQQKQLDSRFMASPIQMKQYEILQQQLGVATDNLTSYIKARESFRLQVAQRTVPWSVLSPPRFSSTPVKPSVPRSLMLSVFLGALAGVGSALLRDRLDHVFHSPRELAESLSTPLLGVVPYLPRIEGGTISQSLDALQGGERFAIKESLRNLFANFRLLRADKPVRLVAITSSTQGEGKTTTTALFAETLAQLGQRVLLIDADMRRPMLHRYVGTDNDKGLSSLLTDPNLTIASVVKPLQPGLDLITAGPVPPDPTQLLSSERCGALVQSISQLAGYDLVLFDTPPALLLSDSVLLSENLDGLIFLVGLSRVNRDLPSQALQRVRDTGVDVLGVLANQPVRIGVGGERYGYGYGYGNKYGYGYGYGYGARSGYGDYASAPAQKVGEAGVDQKISEAVATPPANTAKKSLWPSLRSGSRRIMHWLDERE